VKEEKGEAKPSVTKKKKAQHLHDRRGNRDRTEEKGTACTKSREKEVK